MGMTKKEMTDVIRNVYGDERAEGTFMNMSVGELEDILAEYREKNPGLEEAAAAEEEIEEAEEVEETVEEEMDLEFIREFDVGLRVYEPKVLAFPENRVVDITNKGAGYVDVKVNGEAVDTLAPGEGFKEEIREVVLLASAAPTVNVRVSARK